MYSLAIFYPISYVMRYISFYLFHFHQTSQLCTVKMIYGCWDITGSQYVYVKNIYLYTVSLFNNFQIVFHEGEESNFTNRDSECVRCKVTYFLEKDLRPRIIEAI